MSVTIAFSALWATGYEGDDAVRVPLEKMSAEEHIHGELTICCDGRTMPVPGYFDTGDVCIHTWISGFTAVVETLSKSDSASYIVDECQQGQPAFQFRREGLWVYFSIVDSKITGGTGIPDFCNLKTEYAQFIEEIRAFLNRFDAFMRQTNAATYEKWLGEYFPNGIVIAPQ